MELFKNTWLLFTLIILMKAPALFSQQSVSTSDSPEITAIKEELAIENIKIKPLGGGDGVMLEGNVSSKKTASLAEEISKQYLTKVFNLLSVKRPDYSFKLEVAEYNNQVTLQGGSRYSDILKQGADLKVPWYFSFFDHQEIETFKKELFDFFSARFINLNFPKDDSSLQTISFLKNNKQFKVSLDVTYLDNGFFSTQVSFGFIADNKFISLLSKDFFSRKGEWVAITGFREFPEFKNTQSDLIIIFKPEMHGEAI